eukprot:5898866-Pleurochrysis_carterae.AAC.2
MFRTKIFTYFGRIFTYFGRVFRCFETVFPYLPKICPPPPPMRARARAKNQVCAYAIRSIERVRVSTRVRSQSRTHIAGACLGFRV